MNSPRNSMADRANARVGMVLREKWRLDALLGIGGTASVFAATHRNGKRAAIKILHPELCIHEQLVGRFLREGYVANKLGHPGAVSVLDDDRGEDGSVFLVMELLEGYSLEHHTRRNAERLSVERVIRIADDVLDVLAVAHAKGIVHRDIKPANIFLTREGQVKVLDFGIARLSEPLADGSVTQTGAAIGTPAFMPQEQARGRWNLVDARTDIWAVGGTMFALLTGERLRRAETVQEELLQAMTTQVPSLATIAPAMPAEVVAVVDRALAFEMDARWPDARAMQTALRSAYDVGRARAATEPSTLPRGQPDTAPVIVGAPVVPPSHISQSGPFPMTGGPPPGAPVEVGDTQFTTGRPHMWVPPPASPASRSRTTWIATFAGAFLVSAAALTITIVMLTRAHGAHPPSAAAAPPAPVVTTTPAATMAPAVTASTPAIAESAPAAASAPSATLATSASSSPSSGAAPPVAAKPLSPSGGKAVGAPAAPATPAKPPDANPYDQRF